MTRVVRRDNAVHYTWGVVCDGWWLLDREDLSVIEERMPPGAAEQRHVHQTARQVFYVLSGQLTIDLDAGPRVLRGGDSLHVPPADPHRVRSTGSTEARFLVISLPSTRGDRTNLD